LVLPGTEGRHAMLSEAGFWDDLSGLAGDEIIGVRISLARFAGLLHDQFRNSHSPAPLALQKLMTRLSEDSSLEVRSFVSNGQISQRQSLTALTGSRGSKRSEMGSTFSRPPPPESFP